MRLPVYLVCATALAIAVRGDTSNNEVTRGGNFYDENRLLEPVNVNADMETINYLLPKLAAKYRPSNDWSGVSDPRFYVLTEMESNDIDNQVPIRRRIRNKRFGGMEPSLSIHAPIQTLYNTYEQTKLRKLQQKNRQTFNNLKDIY